jgi:hypothetical protein
MPMTYDEESYILDSITQIQAEVHQNNLMLKDLCNAVNVYLSNHHQENEDDFGRNVLANLISQFIDLSPKNRK